jgi:nucleotidyltransferase substrate binding protein (TIGR01987 family)
MNQELFNLYNEYFTSIEQLRASNDESKETLEKNDVIERFVFSFDIFLEIIKSLVKKHKVNCIYPVSCIKAAVKFGLLAKENIYLQMLEDKYKIIHLKNSRYPEDLFLRVQVKYVPLLSNFLQKVRDNYLV